MDDFDIDEFEMMSDSSDNSSDEECDELSGSGASFHSDEHSDSEGETTSDSEGEVSEEDCRNVLIAQPPEVLQPSVQIERCIGMPDLMKHKGFRLCGDNLDKNVHTRHMRLERRNKSLHYFHLYAVENCVDFVSQTPDNSNITDVRSVVESLLPTPHDDTLLKKNISVLVSRALCKHLDFFKLSCDGEVKQHILTHISDYIPTVSSTVEKTLSTGEKVTLVEKKMHRVLVGGDQMTAARGRAAVDAKLNGQTAWSRLEGIIPVFEDWHTKGNVLGVSPISNS